MENFIVWLIVAAAIVFMIKGFVKTYKGEGGCGGSCGGCTGCDAGPVQIGSSVEGHK